MGATISSEKKEIIVSFATKDNETYFHLAQNQRDGNHELIKALLKTMPEGARYHSGSIETKPVKGYYMVRLYFEL